MFRSWNVFVFHRKQKKRYPAMSLRRLSMVNRKLIIFACVVFVVGLILGSFALRPDLSSRQYKVYPVQADIVHAYFKIYNSSASSGMGYDVMLSYVFVLNITNPSDMTLKLGEIYFSSEGLVSFHRDFSGFNAGQFFEPNTSRLIALSDSSGTHGGSYGQLDKLHLMANLIVGLLPKEGRGDATSITNPDLTLQKISADEYVYGSTFKEGSYLIFGHLDSPYYSNDLDIGHSGTRIG